MYYDGGYYSQALNLLEKIPATGFSKVESAEYLYRKGRIQEALGRDEEAIVTYETVVSASTSKEGHFAPAACLYLAQMYEKKHEKQIAIAYYKKCISYKDYNYKNSFDQKAESGLRRLGK